MAYLTKHAPTKPPPTIFLPGQKAKRGKPESQKAKEKEKSDGRERQMGN